MSENNEKFRAIGSVKHKLKYHSINFLSIKKPPQKVMMMMIRRNTVILMWTLEKWTLISYLIMEVKFWIKYNKFITEHIELEFFVIRISIKF